MNSISLATAGRGFLLIPLTFALAWLALSPAARADCREGCAYPGNTFLGDSALFYNTNGIANTAIGRALSYAPERREINEYYMGTWTHVSNRLYHCR